MNWLCNALLVALCAPLAAQSVRSFDDDDLQRVVDELLPVIEKVCGRKFQSPPVAYLADSVDMERILRVELKAITESELKGQPRSRIRSALQMRAGLQSQGLIGKFEISSGELLVVPKGGDAPLNHHAVLWVVRGVGRRSGQRRSACERRRRQPSPPPRPVAPPDPPASPGRRHRLSRILQDSTGAYNVGGDDAAATAKPSAASYDTIWADARTEPSSGYFEPELQPASITP